MRFRGMRVAGLMLLRFATMLLHGAIVTTVRGGNDSQQKELVLDLQKSLDYVELLEKDRNLGMYFLFITIHHVSRGITFTFALLLIMH